MEVDGKVLGLDDAQVQVHGAPVRDDDKAPDLNGALEQEHDKVPVSNDKQVVLDGKVLGSDGAQVQDDDMVQVHGAQVLNEVLVLHEESQ